MSAYEQRVEPPDRMWQYLLFSAEPYETIAFKVSITGWWLGPWYHCLQGEYHWVVAGSMVLLGGGWVHGITPYAVLLYIRMRVSSGLLHTSCGIVWHLTSNVIRCIHMYPFFTSVCKQELF